ncbi:MAG: biopolymer transporter ExbD [Archangium sp.]|nr:biopolymer transporter ExbD [Archangium sp.]
MAGGMDLGSGGGRGKKRSLDAALNLVPFIDLMAVTVVFLIMTAVWTQLGRVKAASAPQGPCEACSAGQPQLQLSLSASAVTVSLERAQLFTASVGRTSSGRLEVKALRAFLEAWKGQNEQAISVRLMPADDVPAQDVVQLMDVLMGAGLSDVAVE